MKIKTVLAALLAFSSVAFANQGTQRSLNLALKSTLELKTLMDGDSSIQKTDAAKELAASLHAGQRAYDWINALNKNRAPGQKPLSYSDPSTTTNPTMEKPKIYNLEIAKQLYADTAAAWPAWYRQVIEGNDPFPMTLPVSESDFIALGLKTTIAYDTACRWILMQDYIGYYETQKISDMRGYYFINSMQDRDRKLDTFKQLSPEDQAQIHEWMVGVCINNEGFASYDYDKCDNEVKNQETGNKLRSYFASMSPRSKEIWDGFFKLDDYAVRDDLTWTSQDPNTLHYPFLEPTNTTIKTYLQTNVEDEWRLGSWHLKMDFTTDDSSSKLSRLEYQPNTTAHAESNRIVMDENEPLTEYLSQWTIRHEFGHLLGFKDCYVEYYDAKLKAMVNYPLDPTNLMCSRRGHLQPQHVDVLRATYFGNGAR